METTTTNETETVRYGAPPTFRKPVPTAQREALLARINELPQEVLRLWPKSDGTAVTDFARAASAAWREARKANPKLRRGDDAEPIEMKAFNAWTENGEPIMATRKSTRQGDGKRTFTVRPKLTDEQELVRTMAGVYAARGSDLSLFGVRRVINHELGFAVSVARMQPHVAAAQKLAKSGKAPKLDLAPKAEKPEKPNAVQKAVEKAVPGAGAAARKPSTRKPSTRKPSAATKKPAAKRATTKRTRKSAAA